MNDNQKEKILTALEKSTPELDWSMAVKPEKGKVVYTPTDPLEPIFFDPRKDVIGPGYIPAAKTALELARYVDKIPEDGEEGYYPEILPGSAKTLADYDKQENLKAKEQAALGEPRLLTALEKQVGGSHYKNQELQPIEACYMRYGYVGVKATLHTKVDKYLTRSKGEAREQLLKARHCIDLLIEFYDKEPETDEKDY